MAFAGYIVLRSKLNPEDFVITKRDGYRNAMDRYRASAPDDSLIHVPPATAERLLRALPDLRTVEKSIFDDGLYLHTEA